MTSKQKNADNADTVDLSDADTRRILHDSKAMRLEAIKSGLGSGVVGGLMGSIESIFMIPEFVKKFKQQNPEEQFTKRLMETAKKNRLLTALVAAPAAVVVAAGIWGYLSTKSLLHRKQRELSIIEQKEEKETQISSSAIPETFSGGQKRTWVEKTQPRFSDMVLKR